MEQDQLLRRDQSLSPGADNVALLIAAHGEKTPGATNDSVMRIARAIRDSGIVADVAVGFINGVPAIKDALGGLAARKVVVYPLFVSNGYFTRDRLVQLIDEAAGEHREIDLLVPLGLDPGLPELVIEFVARVAKQNGLAVEAATIILLAHGSRRNPASREATEGIARAIAAQAVCREVAMAFLEEEPHLDKAASSVRGPAIVVGMFSGEGLHGARDAPRLVAALGRPDVIYAGVIGAAPAIESVVQRSVLRALASGASCGTVHVAE